MNIGTIVEFRRTGFIAKILGGILKLFERQWDGWGWHLAIVYERADNDIGWYILEATWPSVEINYYSDEFIWHNCRVYDWFNEPPRKVLLNKFMQEHLGKRYDVLLYPWTTIQYLIRHYINRRIPRLLDDKFTCWELVTEICEYLGKPIQQSKYDCPLISDILPQLQANERQRS